MLIQVDINNLVTIQELHLELLTGTTVMTGETGAGKSILIDAIELAVGNRATSDMVRQGAERADISLSFDIQHLPDVQQKLKEYDLNSDCSECTIRRTIQKDGRSRSYINGIPTNLQLLRELSDLMINIHGQHEHQSLFKLDTQRDMLDKYAAHQDLVNQVTALASDCHQLSRTIIEMKNNKDTRSSRSDFLRFQLRELEALHLSPNELELLDLEHKQLANAGELLQNINYVVDVLALQDDHNALQLLNQALHALEAMENVNPKINAWIENVKNTIIQLSETNTELQRYLETIELDPERLQWVEQRIGTLFDVARKHKIAPQELLALQERITHELSQIDTNDTRLVELEQKLRLSETAYLAAATKLSKRRQKAAEKLSREITHLIHELSLPHGQFAVQLSREEVPPYYPHGLEKVIFQITTNTGQPMQPLAKVASGGELSRVSLAIHMATAEQHTIPTLVFDEVDVGIGGGTAEIVGKLLRRLGKTHQVLAITHLPQVAAQGQQHLLVEKHHQQDATYTQIRSLQEAEKIAELARMLGGVEITQKTVDHAREMLEHSSL